MPNVAIVGRPNVGKSALFNRLAGRRIAIVHDQPGITRDRISALCSRGSRPFTLWDTGGIAGVGESELAGEVRRAVQEAIRESDVLLFVVDGREGLSPIDQEIARLLRKSGKPVVIAVNKIDNAKHESLAADFDSLGFANNVSISAEHNRGTTELLETVTRALPAEIENRESRIENRLSIAIVGRPNVGKSSLINSILGNERAIVSELPGTTRDAVDILYERDSERFLFIDTAGIRRRKKHSSSVEVFSVMRAERTIRRADLCVLIIDLTTGVTAQDKRIAGLIQKARKPCVIVLNKWDLIKPERRSKAVVGELVDQTQHRLFFLSYAPVLVASALTRENVDRLFRLIQKIRSASRERIGTGVLNRQLRNAFASNPPPMVRNRRLKLLYATQAGGKQLRPSRRTEDRPASRPKGTRLRQSAGPPNSFDKALSSEGAGSTEGAGRQLQVWRHLEPPEFVLFVNDPRLLSGHYARYLEAQLRKMRSYTGLPITLTLRARRQTL
jgi:GTPase